MSDPKETQSPREVQRNHFVNVTSRMCSSCNVHLQCVLVFLQSDMQQIRSERNILQIVNHIVTPGPPKRDVLWDFCLVHESKPLGGTLGRRGEDGVGSTSARNGWASWASKWGQKARNGCALGPGNMCFPLFIPGHYSGFLCLVCCSMIFSAFFGHHSRVVKHLEVICLLLDHVSLPNVCP